LKKFLIVLLKIGIPITILAYLFWDASNDDAYEALKARHREFGFDWGLLTAAWLCCAAAVLTTLVRWYFLVRTLEIPFSLREALRVGFMGYLFNLAPMGIVGGDLLKAVMLARRQQERRAQAFATVAADRAIGLYMLFVVASVAILLTGFFRHHVASIRFISWGTLGLTVLATGGIVALFTPGATRGKVTGYLGNMRHVGPSVEHLIDAMRMYRRKVHVLFIAAIMSIGVHSLFTVGIYLITRGLYGDVPGFSLETQFIVAPLSAATGVIPLVMGPFEVVLTFLYEQVFAMKESEGLVVALAYRLVTVLIAAVGVCYYLASRQEVAQVMQEAEREQ